MPTIVDKNSRNLNNAVAQVATSAAISGGAAGDLLVAWTGSERGTISGTISGGTEPWTSLGSVIGTNFSLAAAVKRLVPGDTSFTVAGNYSSNRRCYIGYILLRDVLNYQFLMKAADNGNTTAHTAPTITPTFVDALLLSVHSAVDITSTFDATYSAHTGGWTEQLNINFPGATLTKPYGAASTKQLSGGSNAVAQTMDTATSSETVNHGAFSMAFEHGTYVVNNAGADQVVQPWSTVNLTGTGAGPWAQDAGNPTVVTWTGSGANRSFTAPADVVQRVYTFTYGGDPMTVTIAPAGGYIVTGPGTVKAARFENIT